MYSFLRSPRWIAAGSAVAVLALVFVNLGVWQLRRHEERALENTIRSSRLSEPPIPLPTALQAAGGELESLEYRRVEVTGRFAPEEEVLVRSQVRDGRAGFDVVTPLRYDEGKTVLVDRGWVPLELDTPPVVDAAPPTGEVTVTGIVRLHQERPPLGPTEPEGRLQTVARVDIDRLSRQVEGDLAPVWIQVVSEEAGEGLPIPAEPPTFDDPGPHLGYAFQWFAFAVIAVVGFGLLVRRRALRGEEADR